MRTLAADIITMASLRILIVDDHEVIRRGLRSLLSSRPEWEICGEAADGQAAIEKVSSLRPDLVLMDVTMPVLSGTEAAQAIRSRHLDTKIIIISQNDPDVTRKMAAEVGAAGIVSKSDLSRDLLSTIDRVTKELTTTPPAECAESGDEEPRWLRGGGEMGALMRSRDWSNTLLGAIENWPRSLQVQRQAEETARRLSGRILQLQDEERRRIARELHDSVGQYLAMLKITLDRGERSKVGSTAQEIFQQCSQIVDQCISETRTMSHLLHPPLLDESGLLSAVRWYVEGFAARSGIEVQMNLPPSIPRLLKEIETTLFRILQESLTNVHRHSESKKVNVDIFYDAHAVSLRVRDFGKGIPLERIRSFRDRGTGMGVGLGGMRERVRELGGILRIEPCDPSGTVIVIEIPLIEGQKTTVAPLHLETPPQRATQRRSIAAS